jgi:uncharacterized protein (DUF885 family)
MVEASLLPVGNPPPVVPKKDQEDLNIEVYKRVFKKCMAASKSVIGDRERGDDLDLWLGRQVEVAKAMFDRFYNDQTAMKAGQIQAKAMIDGMTSVLEGRR